MPALPTLYPTGDNAVGSWLTDSGGTTNLWQKIEEGIAGATDTNDYVKAPVDTNNSDYKFTITAMPAGFNSIVGLKWQCRYALSGTPPGTNKDTYGLAIRIVNGATILAAADSGGTFATIVSTTTMDTAFTNSAVTAFAYVNTAASAATWNAGVVELRQTYSQAGGKDAHQVYVSAIEFTGTYNVILTAAQGTFTETGVAAILTATRKLTAAVGAIVETGVAATLVVNHPLTASPGTYTLTGVAAGLQAARRVSAATGAFTETGVAAGLTHQYVLTASKGAFVVNGLAAILTYDSSASSGGHRLRRYLLSE